MMSKRQAKKEVFLIITSFIVGGLMMLLMINITIYLKPQNKCTPSNETIVIDNSSLSKSISKIQDAVVVVNGYIDGNKDSTGSGFFYKEDEKYGYILTNEHIIRSKDEIKIINSNEEETDVKILGNDKYLDLAVLRVPKKVVPLVATISSTEPNIGDTVFTCGTPLGYEYRGSITSGIVSGKNRMVDLSEEETGSWQMSLLQIDAPLNHGNSGGALLNTNGEVIGITTLKIIDQENGVEGMGFAIPIEYAMSHINSLENNEKINWPVIGIEMINAKDKNKLFSHEIEIPSDIKKGVVVSSIKEDSAASQLKVGDIIIKVEKKEINDIGEFKYAIYQYKSGDKVKITYIRNKKEHQTTITLK